MKARQLHSILSTAALLLLLLLLVVDAGYLQLAVLVLQLEVPNITSPPII